MLVKENENIGGHFVIMHNHFLLKWRRVIICLTLLYFLREFSSLLQLFTMVCKNSPFTVSKLWKFIDKILYSGFWKIHKTLC